MPGADARAASNPAQGRGFQRLIDAGFAWRRVRIMQRG